MQSDSAVLKGASIFLTNRLMVAFAVPAILAGCTTLQSMELGGKVSPHGIVYYLPETKLDIRVTRTIKDCSETLLIPKISILATAEAVTGADVSKAYVVNYETLQSGMKHTDLGVDLYENGTLKGINVSIADKSGEVLKNVVKIGISIAAMVGGIPIPPLPAFDATSGTTDPSPHPPILTCTPDVKNALQELPKALTNLESKSDQLKRQQQVVEQAKTVTDSESSVRLAAELVKRSQLQTEYDLLVSEVENLQSILTKTQRKLVRPSLSERAGRIQADPSQIERWFNEQSSAADDLLAVRWQVLSNLNSQCGESPGEGLVYRQSAPAVIWLCSGGSQSGPCVTPSGDFPEGVKKLFSAEVLLSQFGQLASLPLRNGPFQTQTLTATFAPTGGLTKAGYLNQASLEKASQSALESLPSVSKFLETSRTADVDALDRETKKIKAHIELEKARKEYEALIGSEKQ